MVVLIASLTVVDGFQDSALVEGLPLIAAALDAIEPVAAFLGDKNVALTVAALAAADTFMRHNDLSRTEWTDELTEALKSGGNIAAITAYLVMMIGAGANIFSWYNDSGFWLVKEIGGLTQGETLRTWTVLTTIISVSGLVTSLVLSTLFPLA